MTDEDVLTVEGVGSAVAGSLPFLLVSLYEECAAAFGHILAHAIEVGAVNGLAAPHSHAVVALSAATAIVPRYEKIVVTAVFEDERRLDGIRPGKP